MLANKFDIILPPQDIDGEPDLQQKLAVGDREAFAWVYKNYCKKVYSYALLVTNNETLSEDIVQEVFLKLWKYKANISSVENFNGYLYTLARNYTLDVLNGNKKRERLHQEYAAGLPLSGNPADELLQFKETRQLIQTAINELPNKQRIVFELRESGLKRPAIAQRLGKTEFAIKGIINRTMHHLRKRL